jgi:hypothetical protein
LVNPEYFSKTFFIAIICMNNQKSFHRLVVCISICCLPLMSALASPAVAQFDFEKDPINYSDAASTDAVAKLKSKLESGEVKLQWNDKQGWLPSLLDHLGVSSESQSLVFSKTSLQIRHITPQTPRAIYFNDDTYLGWVPTGDLIEISAVDDQLGAVFYSIKQQKTDRPEINRDHSNCMTCHGTSKTKYVPGYVVRSVFPSANGQPHYSMGTTTTDHQTDMERRYGGWYVTGDLGESKHRGNKISRLDPRDAFDWDKNANIDSLAELFDTERYLETTSDVVALMVLEHQAQMHNLITRAAYETKQTIHYQKTMKRVLERGEDFESESTVRRIKAAGDDLVEYMLFVGEYELESPVRGGNDYAQKFSQLGPKDSRGRSLREFDLESRMFRYPCSFLIYSTSFDQLPPRVLDYVENRLIDILQGKDDSPEFSHLTPEIRTAILEILVDTKPSFKKRLAQASTR